MLLSFAEVRRQCEPVLGVGTPNVANNKYIGFHQTQEGKRGKSVILVVSDGIIVEQGLTKHFLLAIGLQLCQTKQFMSCFQ